MKRLACVLLAAFAAGAFAQAVALQGTMGTKALLIVDGSSPTLVAPGETFRGVKVLSTTRETATVEADGQRFTLRVGDSQASVGAGGVAQGAGSRIVLSVGSGGHFVTPGLINGQQVRFMVDTGATSIGMSETEAKRLGIAYQQGQMIQGRTANGPVTMWTVKLATVRIGDVEVRDIDASVVPANMPYILLGNSFLSRFSMRKEADTMVLERRY
ncbi:retropepsin-like aspartic protease family protein [Ramlibacter sp. PS4R-6]|uniref:retropepsin-like aspartic protease family protein n=1 Tax=Ramlibacter sp. PS4R-6 TaxID=3133438 RepID=UPI0030B11E21